MLFHDKKRLLLSISGIAFAVVIMFLQMGFFNGINDSQANIARVIDADLVILHEKRTNLNKWTRFDYIRLNQINSISAVDIITPIYKDGAGIKNPDTNQVRRTIIYAFDPEAKPFNIEGLTDEVYEKLRVRGTALFDDRSRDIYGQFKIGDLLEIDERAYTLGGYVSLGPNLVNDGTILMGTGTWRGDGAGRRPIMAFVRLNQDMPRDQAIAEIQQNLPEDTIALTPTELAEREIWYTIVNAPIGAVFAIGLVVSIVIGVVICYQVLYNEVADNIPQYATLKAMGYGPSFLVGIIMEEALLLGILGFLPGLGITFLLYDQVSDMTRLIMFLTSERILLILSLTLVMCIAAALLAIRKVLNLDPADLF